MPARYRLIPTFLLTALVLSACVATGTTIKLQSREGVTQKYLWLPAPQARASIILFAGGSGQLNLSDDGNINTRRNNFLVRSRQFFIDQHFNVALFDAPSDRDEEDGMLVGFRNTHDHATDIIKVINDIKSKSPLPVWLVGTSRGTESTAAIAIDYGENINGLVLTSSISEPNDNGTELPAMALSKITVPTFITAHEDDQCWNTPPDGAETIKNALTNARVVEVKMFRGGSAAKSKPCKGRSAHGFYGIEETVVDAIALFINAHS